MGTVIAIFAIVLFVAAIVCFVLFVVKTIKVKGKRIKKSRRRAIKRFLFASGLFLLSSIIVTAIGMRLFPTSPENFPSADELLTALSEKNEYFGVMIAYDEDTDPNGILGRPGEYISKADFSDTRIEQYSDDNLIGGTIEVFENKGDCQDRADYLSALSDPSMGAFGVNEYIYTYDYAVFRVSYDLTPEQAEEYHQQMNEIIDEWEKTGEIITSVQTESLENTAEIVDNADDDTSYSAESTSSNDEIINQLKELYMEQAEEDLPYSEDDSLSYLEVVLKTSRELANSSSEPEELVNNVLFNSYALSAGYLCNYYDEDSDYGKVGNMAFELMGYIVTEDQENKDRILSEFDEIAAGYGWTIVTLDDSEEQNDTWNETVSESETESEENDVATITIGQRNALNSAKSYLDIMAFSYTGLIEQLEYEGYTTEESTYAADNCGADWNEQAAKSAKNYLDIMSFSRDGLIEQLEYEGFTHEQAVYGVEQNGY